MTIETPELPPLVTLGNPRLASPAAPVPPEAIPTGAFQRRLETLQTAMVHYLGIGIAAPQIGWFERFFVTSAIRRGPDGQPRSEIECWINPEVVSLSDEFNWAWEGCLSVPGLRGWIRRPAAAAVRAINAAGERVSRELAGWDARVWLHEYDHLDGILFPYRARDPRHLVTLEAFMARENWPADWPAPGAREALLGAVVPDPAEA